MVLFWFTVFVFSFCLASLPQLWESRLWNVLFTETSHSWSWQRQSRASLQSLLWLDQHRRSRTAFSWPLDQGNHICNAVQRTVRKYKHRVFFGHFFRVRWKYTKKLSSQWRFLGDCGACYKQWNIVMVRVIIFFIFLKIRKCNIIRRIKCAWRTPRKCSGNDFENEKTWKRKTTCPSKETERKGTKMISFSNTLFLLSFLAHLFIHLTFSS